MPGGPPGGMPGGAGTLPGGAPPAGMPGAPAGAPSLPAPGTGGATRPGTGGAGGGGGPFGGNTQSLDEALAYAESHGGGTVAVASQMGAGTSVREGADVAAIGGFSGRESQVSVAWLADAVEQGRIRYVLGDSTGGGGMPSDGRVGARDVLAVAAETCTPVASVDGLYDCAGKAAPCGRRREAAGPGPRGTPEPRRRRASDRPRVGGRWPPAPARHRVGAGAR